MWQRWRCPGTGVVRKRWHGLKRGALQNGPLSLQNINLRPLSSKVTPLRNWQLNNRPLGAHEAGWRPRYSLLYSSREIPSRFFSSPPADSDPIELHKQRLSLWFSHLPQEEKQFGGFFNPEMHVEPLILERRPEDRKGFQNNPFRKHTHQSPCLTVEQLFELPHQEGQHHGLNVLLFGAVGTGKSTMVRKLVLDWCAGTTLKQFKLLVPFSCEDLSQLSKPTSLRDLVGRKYLHLRQSPLLSGEGNLAKEVLFILNGMERMKLTFRISTTELCSDPNEALPVGTVVVNLLRKYLLPEASILVTTRFSAMDRIPKKYVGRYVQICGFNDPDRQREYFTRRLQQQSGAGKNAETLIELLYLNLQRESQLATACFLPSYCWLTCATLHFLYFTDAQAPIRTLTGIYTSFLRLNFGGEVLEVGGDLSSQQEQISLMLYVVRTVGKLAYDGVTKKRTSFSKEEMEQWVGGRTKTDEELQQLAVFRTDVLDFFLVPCIERKAKLEAGEEDNQRYVFAVPAMQEFLAALYVVLGENKTALEKLGKQLSVAIGQVSEDVTSFIMIISKFIPIRIFAIFNLVRLFPSLFERVSNLNKSHIARTMTYEMFRTEDNFNEDVLDQVEQSLLGVQGPQLQQKVEAEAFELYPIFMGGLLHYGNRVLLDQLGCRIKSTAVAQITSTLKTHLVKMSSKKLPPEELMDVLVLLYEFQNPRLSAEVLLSLRSINLSTVRMTPLKCFVLSSVLSCTPSKYLLSELNLSSCNLNHDLLQMLGPAFRHTQSLNLQFNSLDPEACTLLRDLLLDPNCTITSLQLCDNPLLEKGALDLLAALPENRSLQKLSLMHTGLGDMAAYELAKVLGKHVGLKELNMAYNNIGDSAAFSLVDACREHLSIDTVHLYLNQLSEVGKQSLHVRGVPLQHGGSGRRVKVLASVVEGSDVSQEWRLILNIISKNSASWERARVRQQLQVFLKDLEWGRSQQSSFWKKMHFRQVESGVKQILRMLEKGHPLGSLK